MTTEQRELAVFKNPSTFEEKIAREKCNCDFCKAYAKYKWAKVMECGCACHDGDGITGHDGLCCEFPNALRKNNPYINLEPSEHYKQTIDKIIYTDEKS